MCNFQKADVHRQFLPFTFSNNASKSCQTVWYLRSN